MKKPFTSSVKDSKGFAIAGLLLIFVAVVTAVVVYLFVRSQQAKESDKQVQTIATYEDCVAAGGVPRNDANLQNTICYLTTRKNSAYPAMLEDCTITTCPDLREALFGFCNNNYAQLLNEAQGTFFLEYGAVRIKKGYARGDIWCHQETEVDWASRAATHVFMRINGDEWYLEKVVSDSFDCKEFDGSEIPVALVGPCYDSATGGFRGPQGN